MTKNCPFKRIGNIEPIQPAHSLPLVRRNSGLVDRKIPFSLAIFLQSGIEKAKS